MQTPPVPDDAWDELTEIWQRVGIDAGGLTLRQDGTVGAVRTAPAPPSRPLPVLRKRQPEDEIVYDDLIAEGGMGRVFLAQQASMRRQVAVKVPLLSLPKPMHAELLREAHVTGALQHPGIVPVYAVGADHDGAPMVVMPHLTGQTWADRLLIERAGAREPALNEHLSILERVADAVAYAHARGVIHRDLKPDNIMLGEFGEVHVLDWGLAVAADESVELIAGDTPLLRQASDISRIEGTVHYMSPEMASADGAKITRATDVYLLGAILHEILTGSAPHAAPSGATGAEQAQVILLRVFTAEPPELPGVTPQLAELCRRSLANDVDERYADAREFRDALASYRAHARAAEMIRDGEGALEEAARSREAASERRAQGKPSTRETAEAERLVALARFNFEQALREQPGHVEARRMLNETLVRIAEEAVAERRVDDADAALRRITGASDALWAKATKLKTKVARERRIRDEVHAATSEASLQRGSRARKRVGLAFGLVWMAAHVVLGQLVRTGAWVPSHVEYALAAGTIPALFVPVMLALYQPLFGNKANRRLNWSIVVMLFGQAATFVALGMANVSLSPALGISLVQLSFVIAVKATIVDRRVAWTAPLVFGLGVLAASAPTLMFECVGVAYSTYFIAGGLLTWDGEAKQTPDLVLLYLEGKNERGGVSVVDNAGGAGDAGNAARDNREPG